MGYRIGYNGPQVDDLLQKGYKYSVINNGWTKLESSDLAATNLDTLVTPGNYSTSFWQNGPIQLVTNGPINVCVTKDSSSNTLYQTIYDAGKIYIRSTTSTSFSNTWREEQNNSTLDIGASTPVNPSDNYIWIDTSGDAPVIKIYKENKGEWVAISAADLAKKSVYDKNNVGKPFTTYLDEKIAEGDLATAEDAYKKHIVEGEDTGNPIHVTSEEKLKWNAGISTSEADTLINKFKKDMQSYADEKVNTSSTKINEITTEVNAQKKIMDNHMGDSNIHLTADQATAFDNKAAGDHTHLNDGTVTVSTTNLTGLIPIERLDPSVLERNYTVNSYDDLFNLTKNEVQNGDSVFVGARNTDEVQYTLESTPVTTNFIYNPDENIYVAIKAGTTMFSSDGKTWTTKTNNLSSYYLWRSIAYANGTYVIICDYDSTEDRLPAYNYAYSTDKYGETWTIGSFNGGENYFVNYANNYFYTGNYYSSDGITWSKNNFTTNMNISRFVYYANNIYVAVSIMKTNKFAYSTDGITWTEGTMPSSQYWEFVCYGNNKFVAIVIGSNVFAYSTDGINWTEGTMPSSQYWVNICYGNNVFVAAARNSVSQFYYSFDGIIWKTHDTPNKEPINHILYNDSKFIGLTYNNSKYKQFEMTINPVKKSNPSAWFVVDDSKLGEYNYDFTWKESSFPNVNNWVKFCYGNGKLIVISGDSTPRTPNVFAYSSDGINWTEGNIPSDCNKIRWVSICYGNGRFIVVGWHINYYLYSTDGINWIKGTLPSNQTWNDVCYGNGKYIIIAQNTTSFVYSTDGINWTESNMPSKRTWYKLCYGNDKFVAISRLNGNINSVFAYSSDGINWTESDSPSNQKWNDICYGDGKFVAIVIGSNVFAYSTDGINWTEGTMPMTLSWDSIVYNSTDHLFVSLGTMIIPKTESQQYDNYTYIAYSKDGIKWSHMIMSKENHYISIYCMNGNYLAILNVQRGDDWSASYLYYDKFVYSPLTKLPTALVQYAAPTPELTWDNITNKPTTISDYGLSNTYYTEDEINALYKKYKDQYDEINKSVSDITNSLLEIPEDLSTTYDTNLARASELNKKLDDLLHSLGLNDKMISDMVNMYKERSIIYRSSLDTEIDFDSLTVGSTFKLGKYQVESEDPWDIEWEIVHQTADYQIARVTKIIDFRPFDAKEPNNPDSDRKGYGNNNWSVSNIKQFLNSDQASWYSAQHQYDAPPSSANVWNYPNGTTYNAYDTHKGFLYYWSDNEKSILKDMTFTLANNTITDGGGSYTWTGKVFLPTYTQMGWGQNNSISEGEVFSKFSTTAGKKITIHEKVIENNEYCKIHNYTTSTNASYLLSSTNTSYSYRTYTITADGSGSGNLNVFFGNDGLAPCICLPRTGKFVNKHDFTKEIIVKYLYLNSPTDNLPTEVINNKPTDSIYHVDYSTNSIHTIDDDHYPAGYIINSTDKTGYWEFSGWEIDTGKKTVTVHYEYNVNGDSSLLPDEVYTNKPSDSTYDVDYYDESKSNYTHTIDDEHYPEGYTINSTDNSGYWEFSGWKE